MDTRVQTHKTYGFITGLAIVVTSLIIYVSGKGFEKWAQWVAYIPFLIGLILNAQAYSKANGGYITFGQAFSSCFKAVAIITLVVLAWTLASTYIFPEMKEKAFEIARQSMEKDGATEEQMEMGLNMTRKYFTMFMVMGVVFGYMFVGAILSLIAAAVAPKKKGVRPQFDTVNVQP